MFLVNVWNPKTNWSRHGWVNDFDKVFRDVDKMLDSWPKFPELNVKSNLSLVTDLTYITDDGTCVVELVVPGYSKEDVTVSVTEEKLTVDAKAKEKKKHGLSLVGFTRAYTLDRKYDVNTVSAVHKDGVLTITLQPKEKAAEKNARKVEIK